MSENVYTLPTTVFFFLYLNATSVTSIRGQSGHATRYPALEVRAKLEDKVRNDILSCTNTFSFLPFF